MAAFLADPQNVFLLSVVLAVWTLPWKGWALWLAARRHEKIWFIVMLVLNTVAILEIIYIFFVAKRTDAVTPAEPADTDLATTRE